MTTTWWQVVILGVIFVGGALWLAKKVIQAVVSLFSGDRDDDSQGLPRHSHTHQERRALRDSSQRHYTHSGPSVQRYNLPTGGTRTSDHGTHASASSQKISAYKISPPVDLSDFLPIYDRQSYEAARAEARRLQNLKDGHLTRQRRAAERQGRRFDVHHYKDIIDTLGDNIDRLNAESSAWIYQGLIWK
ncbi:hypothetical protein BS17DRAFT_458631 [Gyrodon lividus]|nr:hypothetical protein BS17DRAFT_458631 [Gyrodon lividus]